MFFDFDEIVFQVLSITKSGCRFSLKVSPRPYAAISIRLTGSATFCFENKSFVSAPGNIVFIPAGVGYEVTYKDSEAIVVRLTDCNYCMDVEEFTPNDTEYIMDMFRQLFAEWKANSNKHLIKANIYLLLNKIAENSLVSKNPTFLKCKEYIEAHYLDNDLKLEDVCKFGNISEMCLYRYFMKYLEMPPKQYIIKLRIGYAIELITKGECSVSKAAKLSGFCDEKHFSKFFKKRFGVPPSHYKGPM